MILPAAKTFLAITSIGFAHAHASNIRNLRGVDNEVTTDELSLIQQDDQLVSDDAQHRKLGTTYSYKYQYQTHKWWKYTNTDYYWCVEDTQNECFPNTIGQNEFWDNDRIIYRGSGQRVGCASRTDIGSGTCKYDSRYKDFWGVACGGKDFNVYMC